MLPHCPKDEKGDMESAPPPPPSACESSEAKHVMVILARDCGRVRALNELLWVVVVFERKEIVRGFSKGSEGRC
jgi:hypothetical protein